VPSRWPFTLSTAIFQNVRESGMEQPPSADKRRDFADGVGSISYENGDHFRGRFSNNGETLELGIYARRAN